MPDSLTQAWLRHNIRPYPATDRLYPDVDAALARYPTLRPKTDVYTYDDGRTQLLLCIHGLLPIRYRNAAYNIPVALWLTFDYPRLPPIAYVVPTSDMLVKAARHLDVSGRCDLPYQQNWQRKSEGCTLIGLIESMQDLFSREPPLYARPPPTTQTAPPEHTPSPLSPPALPPKPASSSHSGPTPPSSLTLASRPPHLRASSITHPPPPSAPPSHRWSTPMFSPPMAPISPPPPQRSPPSVISYHPPPPPQHWSHPPTSIPPPNILDAQDDDTPSPNPTPQPTHAPPRPPNPELLHLHTTLHSKLTSSLSSLSASLQSDTARLQQTQRELLAGAPAVQDEMARLEAVRDVCRAVAGRMRPAVQAAEDNVAELRRKGDVAVDELVCSTTIVYNQLFNLVAEDNAIEDTVYHLHRALNAGRIDLERFLRTTRVLAEDQFMKRALIEKISAGIPMGVAMGTTPSSAGPGAHAQQLWSRTGH